MYAKSRGYRLHYVTAGDGPELVLIPGITQSVERWIARGYVERFARHFRVIAVDPLGHGESDKPHAPDAYTMDGCALDVVAVLDAEGVGDAHVWGYSRGSGIAATVATLNPERVDGLIIGGGLSASLAPPIQAIADDNGRKQIEVLRSGDYGAAMSTFGVNDPELRETLLEANDMEAIAAAIEGSIGGEPRLDLSHLRRAPLAYAGEHETFLALLKHTAGEAGAEFHVIEGCDHAEAFASIEQVAPIVEAYLGVES